jgi:hypothetical protein
MPVRLGVLAQVSQHIGLAAGLMQPQRIKRLADVTYKLLNQRHAVVNSVKFEKR